MAKKKSVLVELRDVELKGIASSTKVDQDGGRRRVTKLTFDYEGQDDLTAALLPLQRNAVLRLNIEPVQGKLDTEGEGDGSSE